MPAMSKLFWIKKFGHFPHLIQENVDVTFIEATTVHITLSYSESNLTVDPVS